MRDETTRYSARRRPRLWPLLLSGLALLGLARSGIELRKQFEVSRNAVHTFGWVTGKGGENSGIIYYAYHVNQQTYGGRYRLSRIDSDFDLTRTGDGVNVIYSNSRPYLSIVGDDPSGSLATTATFSLLWFIAVLTGMWLSAAFPREAA